MSNNFKYCKLNFVGKINGLAQESRKASRKLLLHKQGLKNCKIGLKSHKQLLGSDIRHHLLAYAFLYGKKYSQMESKCAENNRPNPDKILNILKVNLSEWDFKYFNIEKITKWLSGDVL